MQVIHQEKHKMNFSETTKTRNNESTTLTKKVSFNGSFIEEKYLFSINVAINGVENGKVGSILVREGD
jgi:hypothetical protein